MSIEKHYKIVLIDYYMESRRQLLNFMHQQGEYTEVTVRWAVMKELMMISGRLRELYREAKEISQ